MIHTSLAPDGRSTRIWVDEIWVADVWKLKNVANWIEGLNKRSDPRAWAQARADKRAGEARRADWAEQLHHTLIGTVASVSRRVSRSNSTYLRVRLLWFAPQPVLTIRISDHPPQGRPEQKLLSLHSAEAPFQAVLAWAKNPSLEAWDKLESA